MRPDMLWWRMGGGIVLVSVLGPAAMVELAHSYDSNGRSANRSVLRQRVPYGAIGWSLKPTGPWTLLRDLPAEWRLGA
jgi:hypothetical protein